MRRCCLLLVLAAAVTLAPSAPAQEPAGAAEKAHAQERSEPSIVWKIANFAILVGFLGYMISKGAGKFFENRTQQIQQDLAEAARIKKEADARVAEMERRIARLSDEIEMLRADMRREMAAEGERIRLETERRIQRIQEQAAQDVESMIKSARRELRLHAADLAIKLAEEQLHGRITSDVENDLVKTFIADVRAKSGAGAYN